MIITQDSLPSNFADVKWYLANFLLSKSVVELSQLDLQKCPGLNLIFVETREKKLLLKYVNSYPKIGIYF